MAHRLTKEAITTYVSAIQEVVAAPAYTTVTYERRAVTSYSGGQASTTPVPQYGFYTDRYGRKVQGIIGFTFPKPGIPSTRYVDVPIYTYHPAVVGVVGRDATTLTDGQLGWNAGAQSVGIIDGDFVVECVVDSAVQGVLVGIQPAGGQVASFNALEHAVLISPSQSPSAVERGSIKATGGPVSGAIKVRIERINGKVRCLAGESLSYSSSTRSSGPMVMSAVICSGGDSVDDARLLSVHTLSSTGDWGWGTGSADARLQASSTWSLGGYASINDGHARLIIDLSVFASEGDYSAAEMRLDEPALKASGFNDVDLSVAVMALPMTLSALGVSIDIGSASSVTTMTMRSGDYDYGDASLVIDHMSVYSLSNDEPQGYESASEALFVGDYYVVDPVAYATLVDSLQLGSAYDLILRMDLDLADHLVLMDEASIGLIISALLENKIGLADASVRTSRDTFEYINSVTGLSGLYDFTGSTYSTNILTGAVSRYAGFDFDGFCRVGMDTYGYRKDGLYRIGGDTDGGSYIGARADFGAEDFGTAQGKRVGNIFMGLATDGQVYVRTVEDGDQEMVYRAYERKGEYRADMQRGRASRFWRLRLEVVESNYAELDNIEWVLTQTGRRSN
jgi:hypothetical protein